MFPCLNCEKTYQQKNDLIKHNRYVHEMKTYTCEICEKVFTNKNKLRCHHTYVHEESGKSQNCDLCNKS